MKIIIEKKSEEITYRRSESTIEFAVNGKPLKVYVHEDYDDMTGSDYDIDEKDRAKLTDEEYEAFTDEDVWEMLRAKDGDKREIDY